MNEQIMEEKLKAFERLLIIMDELREQCPWDKKQTFQSLRKLTIEETYELAEELLKEDTEGIKEEVGDLMLHMVFYSKIGEESGAFDVADVLNGICEKLIKRHPHISTDSLVCPLTAIDMHCLLWTYVDIHGFCGLPRLSCSGGASPRPRRPTATFTGDTLQKNNVARETLIGRCAGQETS